MPSSSAEADSATQALHEQAYLLLGHATLLLFKPLHYGKAAAKSDHEVAPDFNPTGHLAAT